LDQERPQECWPAASTIGTMLAGEGLVVARQQRRRVPFYTQPFAAADEPNRIWCADFKGWFRAGDGTRIDPLTISDACSRYLLRCQAVEKPTARGCRPSSKPRFAYQIEWPQATSRFRIRERHDQSQPSTPKPHKPREKENLNAIRYCR